MQAKKSNENGDTDTSATPCDCSKNTWVYVWKLTTKKVGHTAIQVGGCKPKMDETDSDSEYISIHPNGVPALGPTTVLPLPATIATTLTQDMESEASSLKNIDLTELTGLEAINPVTAPTHSPPDFTFRFQNLDTDAMREMIATTKEDVARGETRYQLLPRIDVLSFFKNIAQHINYNPIDAVGPSKKSYGGRSFEYRKYNCATLVSAILASGGLFTRPSRMPWRPTPNDIMEDLSRKKP